MAEPEATTMKCLMEAMEAAMPPKKAREECGCASSPKRLALQQPQSNPRRD